MVDKTTEYIIKCFKIKFPLHNSSVQMNDKRLRDGN